MKFYERWVVRLVLRIIVMTLMLENANISRTLWVILTALRGPDFDDDGLKDVTTTKIRRLIGLTPNFRRASVAKTATIVECTSHIYDKQFSHFYTHFRCATESLMALKIKDKL